VLIYFSSASLNPRDKLTNILQDLRLDEYALGYYLVVYFLLVRIADMGILRITAIVLSLIIYPAKTCCSRFL